MTKDKFIPALGYNFLTAWYDLAIKITMPEKIIRSKLVEELELLKGEKILEFGFGTGQNLILIKKTIPDIDLEGLDIDPKVKEIALRKLKKNNLEIPLNLYNGKVFPYKDNQFNKVYSCLVFHQLDAESKLKCLKEIHRVLKPSGTLIIADWGKAQNILMRFTFKFVQFLDGFKTTNDNVKGLLPKFISNAGFLNVVIVTSINTMLGTFSYFKAIKAVNTHFKFQE